MTGSSTAPGTSVLAFDDLDGRTAYDLWRLRQEVFVVEQDCVYADLDGRDLEPGTRHVLLRAAPDGSVGPGGLLGYLRTLDEPDGSARIGRVVLRRSARGRGLADVLMTAALAEVGDRVSVLDAQAPLARFYGGFGYVATGEEFLEDGIPHVPMRREASSA